MTKYVKVTLLSSTCRSATQHHDKRLFCDDRVQSTDMGDVDCAAYTNIRAAYSTSGPGLDRQCRAYQYITLIVQL